MFRKFRITSQLFFFLCFIILLFYFNTSQWVHRFPTELFLQLNPLVALLTSIASRNVITAVLPGALIVTVITILFGRVFCGFICPLGSAIDFTDTFIIGKARNVSRRPHLYLQRLKYVFLFALLFLSLIGIVVPFFLDPISIATRIVAVIIDPALRNLGMSSINLSTTFSNFFSQNKRTSDIISIAMPGSLAALSIFTAVFIGGFWDKRFWCQYICPTGAFFGFLSKFPLLRRIVREGKCNNCRVCATRQCPTRAIHHDAIQVTSTAECIVCGVCAQNRRNCTNITIAVPKASEIKGPNLARRHLLSGILIGIIAPSIIKGTGIGSSSSVPPVRPPGSIPEDDFLTRCIACGECIKACPGHALRPSGFSEGLLQVNTPRLAPSIGYCDPLCTTCTHVCPTVAIRPVSIEDKPFVKIGTAVVDTNRCLAWRGEIRCLVCMNKCPYQAITEQELLYSDEDEFSRSGPVVDKDLCTGCGACEHNCAFTSNPAIQVHTHGEKRISKGPVISEKKRDRIIKLRESLKN